MRAKQYKRLLKDAGRGSRSRLLDYPVEADAGF
jgi:hypothetical protein